MQIMKRFPLLSKVILVGVVLIIGYMMLFLFAGYPTINGTVVDAQTGKPIEGATVLCVWTYTTGVIERIHRIAKVSEAVSDAQGRVKVRGTWNIFVDPPELTLYKRGYVAWNNQDKFISESEWRDLRKVTPDLSMTRTDFSWKNGFVAIMEKWKEGYSFIEHESFVSMHTSGARTKSFAAAMDWERLEQVKEADRINEQMGRGRRRR